MNNSKPHIVFGIDDRYLPPILVSLYTALKTATGSVNVTVMSTGPIDEQKIELIANYFPEVSLEIREFSSSLLKDYEKVEAAKKFPIASMVPLFIPWLIDSKCLFLDADTLILKDISRLFATDLNGFLIGATPAYHIRQYTYSSETVQSLLRHRKFVRLRKEHQDHKSKINFSNEDYENKYFSSGVVLFDAPAIRANDSSMEKLLGVIENKNLLAYLPDQDILNVYYKNRVCLLDVQWNVYKDILGKRKYLPTSMNSIINEATRDPAILHYAQIYDRRCWEDSRRKLRRYRYRVYRQSCIEIENEIGINVSEMFRSRV